MTPGWNLRGLVLLYLVYGGFSLPDEGKWDYNLTMVIHKYLWNVKSDFKLKYLLSTYCIVGR